MTQTGIGFAIGFLSACSTLWDRIAITLEDGGLHLRRGIQVVAFSAGAVFLADGLSGSGQALDHPGAAQSGQAPTSDFIQAPPLSTLHMLAQPCGIAAMFAFLLLQLGDLGRQTHALRARPQGAEENGAATASTETRPSARERALERHLAELEDWRIRLERQSQKLADIADQSLREKAIAERSALQRQRILAAMSHELHTPLNAIIGFSDVMQLEVFGPIGHARYRDYASHINDSGQGLLNAIRSILQLIETDRLNALLARDETVGVASIIENARRAMLDFHPETVIEVGPVCRTSRICGDAAALRQAVMGLMSAADEKLPEGSCVQVATRILGQEIEIRIGANLPNDAPHAAARSSTVADLRNRLEIALARSIFGVYGGSVELVDPGAPSHAGELTGASACASTQAGTVWLINGRLPMAEPPFPGAFSPAAQRIDLAAPPLPVLATHPANCADSPQSGHAGTIQFT